MDCNKPRVVCAGEHKIITGDCLEILKSYQDDFFDLVVTSPPYGSQRSYSIGFKLDGEEYVAWSVSVIKECLRVCKGLVAWNVQGPTKNYKWSALPVMIMADLHREGVCLRNPPIFHRIGISGSGSKDWLRSDYEYIICATKRQGRLPWSDNTACGHPPKYGPGGAHSHRKFDGTRVNNDLTTRPITGAVEPQLQRAIDGVEDLPPGTRIVSLPRADGTMRRKLYKPPEKANPGNVITLKTGGGHLGSKLAHENEAPFPLALPTFFLKSFCPPGGLVLDPFGGSGTTLHAAVNTGRICHSIDIRDSQRELTLRRFHEAIAGLQGSVHPNGSGDRPGEGADPRSVDSGGGVAPSGEAEPGDYNPDRQD